MEGRVPELVVVGLGKRVAVIVKEVVRGNCEPGIVVADYL